MILVASGVVAYATQSAHPGLLISVLALATSSVGILTAVEGKTYGRTRSSRATAISALIVNIALFLFSGLWVLFMWAADSLD